MFSIPKVPAGQRPMLRFLLVLSVASMVGLQVWRTLINNFAVEWANLDGSHIGVIQSVREIPGFLALLAIYVMLIIREHKLSALSILILGIGVGGTGYFPSFAGITFTTLLMSFGFHYYETTNQSLTLQYFDQATAPLVLGSVRSLSAATNVVVGIAVFFMSMTLDYRLFFSDMYYPIKECSVSQYHRLGVYLKTHYSLHANYHSFFNNQFTYGILPKIKIFYLL